MVNYVIGSLLILIVFSIAYAYLKPHRLHHTRPLSTLAFKVSYLLYLLVLLTLILLASIRGGGVSQVFDGGRFFLFLIVLFLPTAALLARKLTRISGYRTRYNLIFSAVNILLTIVAVVLYKY